MLVGRIARSRRQARIGRLEGLHAAQPAGLVLGVVGAVDREAHVARAVRLVHVHAEQHYVVPATPCTVRPFLVSRMRIRLPLVVLGEVASRRRPFFLLHAVLGCQRPPAGRAGRLFRNRCSAFRSVSLISFSAPKGITVFTALPSGRLPVRIIATN